MDVESRLKRQEWMSRFLLILVLLLAGSIAIRHVHAQARPATIVADSIETHSLTIDNPYGKQGVKIEVGNSGTASITMTDVNGKKVISLVSTAAGVPSICLAYRGDCRVVLGDVYRGNQREMSIQLRDKNGHPVWMPPTPNPFVPSRLP